MPGALDIPDPPPPRPALRIAARGPGRRAPLQAAPAGVLPFGLAEIDAHLPPGGLRRGALHEVACGGPEIEHGAAAALLIGGRLGATAGLVLWVMERPDLFAPALAAVGLPPGRLVQAAAGPPEAVLAAMEEGLRQPGLAAVVGEVGRKFPLIASRRLQLAAEKAGTLAFVLRRSRVFDDPALTQPSAAVTRWRVTSLPSAPPLPEAPDVPGLGPPRWRLDLLRCRGADPASWTVEMCDAPDGLRLVPEPVDRSAARDGRFATGHRRA